jgi:hypothetical protein
MVNGRRVGETVGFDIAHWRLTEEAFVLAGELTYAVISRAEPFCLTAELGRASALARSEQE